MDHSQLRKYASRTLGDAIRPHNVGILAMEIYFPSQFVSQVDLEKHDNVGSGKYTVGLGQNRMAVCTEREDINSTCLTAVHSLLEKYNVPYDAIGRLEVGTETIVDKSKAVKTTLMRLFEQHGNTDIEGVDSKNACYGGTAALLNSLAWVESSAWDGRYALVVAGDIAVYEKGPARPTGGAGVVVMLVGPDAPLVVEPGLRATHMEDVFDFYKPTLTSEYPRVDGHLSNSCFLRSIDNCYNRFAEKFERRTGQKWTLQEQADFCVFHAPYNKLVQKSFGRYLLNDYKRHPEIHPEYSAFDKFLKLSEEESYTDKDLQKAQIELSKDVYKEKVQPSELITKECGNSYCGSLYAGLLSLITNKAEELVNKRILMFSYGSGLAATLFSIRCIGDVTHIRDTTNVVERLNARKPVSPEKFEEILGTREKTHAAVDYTPQTGVEHLFKGTYYISSIDKLERRSYARAYHTQTPRPAPGASIGSHRFPLLPRPAPSQQVAMGQPRLLNLLGTTLRTVRSLRR